jgi:ATP-binding cassette subfamily B protein
MSRSTNETDAGPCPDPPAEPVSGRPGLWDRVAPPVSGQALVDDAPRVPLRPMVARFWPFVRPFRFGICLLVLLSIAAPGVESAEIWLFKHVIDDVLTPHDLGGMYALGLAFVGLAAAGGVVGWIDSYLAAWMGEHLQLRVRAAMLAALQSAGTTTLDRLRAGDVLTRLTSDTAAVEGLMISVLVSLVGSLAKLVFFGGALFLLDWKLTLLSFTVVPAFWLTGQRFARRLKEVSRARRRWSGSLTSVAEESLAVMALVQIHGREAEEAARFDSQARSVLAAELRAARLSATFPLVVDLMELAGILAVMAGGTWALGHDKLSLGGLLVFLTFLSQMYGPVKSLGNLGNGIAMALAGMDRVAEVLDIAPGVSEAADPVVLDPATVHGHLELREVGYTYPGRRQAVVAAASARFRPGLLTVLTGPSGSGKSTLIRLLARLDDPQHGTVRLDGTDLREVSIRSLRDAVTVLPQEAPVFDASVRDNITFARPDADDQAVWAALRLAGVDDVVATLPGGLDARLGQRGRWLSGGQRQRIALARALVTGARVLILDEPTTGLDNAAAHRFLATLRSLAIERTVIVATHDANLVAAADVIIRLERWAPPAVTESPRVPSGQQVAATTPRA